MCKRHGDPQKTTKPALLIYMYLSTIKMTLHDMEVQTIEKIICERNHAAYHTVVIIQGQAHESIMYIYNPVKRHNARAQEKLNK